MNNSVTPEMTIELLEEAGVNKTVINYLRKNPTLLYEKTKEIIGTDFAPEVSHFKANYIEKIKKGTDSFKILDNGDIWMSNFKSGENKNIHDGLFRDPSSAKYKNTTENITLTSDEGNIVKRTITHKGFVQEGQYYYDSSLIQENYDNNNNLVDGIEARWENNPNMSLPNNVYGFSFTHNSFTNTRETQMDGHYINVDNPEWNLVSSGKKQEIINEQIETPKKKNEIIGRFKLIKNKAQQLFSNKKEKTTKTYEEEMKEFKEIEKQLQGLPTDRLQDQMMSTEEILAQAQRSNNSSSYISRQR